LFLSVSSVLSVVNAFDFRRVAVVKLFRFRIAHHQPLDRVAR
jgi:hypothetical protein